MSTSFFDVDIFFLLPVDPENRADFLQPRCYVRRRDPVFARTVRFHADELGRKKQKRPEVLNFLLRVEHLPAKVFVFDLKSLDVVHCGSLSNAVRRACRPSTRASVSWFVFHINNYFHVGLFSPFAGPLLNRRHSDRAED
jgi:hypothetical protein